MHVGDLSAVTLMYRDSLDLVSSDLRSFRDASKGVHIPR